MAMSKIKSKSKSKSSSTKSTSTTGSTKKVSSSSSKDLKGKEKSLALATSFKVTNDKNKKSAIGAPAQLNQSSRKGKKAWRKHVDIGEVESALEEMRAEERVVGTAVNKLQDSELFFTDTKGDDKIRHTLPRFSVSQLTSTKILSQRSAVPAVFSRPSASSSSSSVKRKSVLSREDKERLLRIAKRPRKGPFNSILDPAEYESGSGVVDLSNAVKSSGGYDAWAEEGGGEEGKELEDGMETVYKRKIKAPSTTKTKDLIEIPAIVQPHQGTSYNPPVEAHQELLMQAAAIEKKHLEDLERTAEVKNKMDNARMDHDEYDISVAVGMKVQDLDLADNEDEEGAEDGKLSRQVVLKKKTKTQRNKAARLLVEKKALADKALRKRLNESINDAKALRRSTAREVAEREEAQEKKRLAQIEKLKTKGLAGTKLGKHKVPEGRVEVQLGEDLSENLRGLKPEGSLFHDRFQSLQQRALIEPRVPVLPKKRKHRMIEYEKHAWKKFE